MILVIFIDVSLNALAEMCGARSIILAFPVGRIADVTQCDDGRPELMSWPMICGDALQAYIVHIGQRHVIAVLGAT
jgi:hypothetical protein